MYTIIHTINVRKLKKNTIERERWTTADEAHIVNRALPNQVIILPFEGERKGERKRERTMDCRRALPNQRYHYSILRRKRKI